MMKIFLRVFGDSEGDLGHEDVLLLSETECQAEEHHAVREVMERASTRGL